MLGDRGTWKGRISDFIQIQKVFIKSPIHPPPVLSLGVVHH